MERKIKAVTTVEGWYKIDLKLTIGKEYSILSMKWRHKTWKLSSNFSVRVRFICPTGLAKNHWYLICLALSNSSRYFCLSDHFLKEDSTESQKVTVGGPCLVCEFWKMRKSDPFSVDSAALFCEMSSTGFFRRGIKNCKSNHQQVIIKQRFLGIETYCFKVGIATRMYKKKKTNQTGRERDEMQKPGKPKCVNIFTKPVLSL